MFGFGKKKKNKKDSSLDSEIDEKSNSQDIEEPTDQAPIDNIQPEDSEEPEVELTESQKEKKEKLDSVKSKISKILKSSNIEIIDENIGDEYDDDEISESEKQKQQDYDSLKAIFGKDDKNKKQELTLTIDDFDYTYIGKYVDEYDLMHRKNIKKIKLPSKYGKILKKVAIIVVAIGILVGGIIFAVNFTAEPAYYLSSISLSQYEQSYFVNENFDYTGIYIYATYSNGKNSYTETISLKNDYYRASLSRGAFTADSRSNITFNQGTEAYLGFSYGGLTCTIKINIKTKIEESLTVKYTNGLFELSSGDTISNRNLFALIDYSNYNSELLELSSLRIYVDGSALTYDITSRAFILTNDITESSIISIMYDDYTVTLTYIEGSRGINQVTSENAA